MIKAEIHSEGELFMIHSQKEQKRRKRFRVVLILLVAAIVICIGVLVGSFFSMRSSVADSAASARTPQISILCKQVF